jgi:type IX secretion system PorP/SprF family membrane protein
MRKILLILLLVTGISSLASAQMDPQYTMYMFNRQAINPAYAGTIHATNLTLLGRSQWVGINGAPETTTASIHGYVKAIHGGLGGYLIGDKLGPLSTIGAKANYAFHMHFSKGTPNPTELSIGVGGGIYQKSLNGIWKYDLDPTLPDPLLTTPGGTKIVPDLDAGVYFHAPIKSSTSSNVEPRDRFYIGASISHLLEPSIDDVLSSNVGPETVIARGITGMAGVTFKLSPTIYLQPSANFRMAGPLKQFDITANLYVSPMVFGISHRWKDSFSGIIGFNATTQLFMAYSYDYTISGLRTSTTGSHEIIISYTFPQKDKREAPEDYIKIKQGLGPN